METIFPFSRLPKDNAEFIYSLNPKSTIILHITGKNYSTESLYFTNEMNKKINIPNEYEFIVYKRYSDNELQILNPRKNNTYKLSCSSDYDIFCNCETILNIRNERTWTIWK